MPSTASANSEREGGDHKETDGRTEGAGADGCWRGDSCGLGREGGGEKSEQRETEGEVGWRKEIWERRRERGEGKRERPTDRQERG